MKWFDLMNPLIIWSDGKTLFPNSVYNAQLSVIWLYHQHKIGTANIISTYEGLEEIKNESLQNRLTVCKSPKFWTKVNIKNSVEKKFYERGNA